MINLIISVVVVRYIGVVIVKTRLSFIYRSCPLNITRDAPSQLDATSMHCFYLHLLPLIIYQHL